MSILARSKREGQFDCRVEGNPLDLVAVGKILLIHAIGRVITLLAVFELERTEDTRDQPCDHSYNYPGPETLTPLMLEVS